MRPLLLLSLLCVAVLCLGAVFWLDRPILLWMQAHREPLLPFFTYASMLGHGTMWFLLAGSLLLIGLVLHYKLGKRHHPLLLAGGFGFCALCITGLVLRLAKYGFGRYRPRYFLEEGLYQFAPFSLEFYKTASFPSGHAQMIASVMTVIALFRPRLAPLCILIALLVAASRVVLLQHYLADVVAGLWLGAAIPLLLWQWWHGYAARKHKPEWRLCI